MLRLRRAQASLWESVLPEEILKLSEELTKVDVLLEDERFFAPFREKFSCCWGRSTVPIATYLRLMYLKFRYKLGYKALVREVQDSFTWRRFCHLSFHLGCGAAGLSRTGWGTGLDGGSSNLSARDPRWLECQVPSLFHTG